MSETGPLIALAGNPNCGKTALFNALTGGRAKVGNYPGVTVERKEGVLITKGSSEGRVVRILDLPGTYTLVARTPDEEVTRDLLAGKEYELILAVVDATQLERSLSFILELKALGKPMLLALNMFDLARASHLELDLKELASQLGMPVVTTAAIRGEGIGALRDALLKKLKQGEARDVSPSSPFVFQPTATEIRERFHAVDQILARVVRKKSEPDVWTRRIDKVVLHPLWGALILIFILGSMFQAIFTWAQVPMEAIKGVVVVAGHWIEQLMPTGPFRSLIVDGILSGVGSVIVFLPQILLLFLFILFLEDSGYLPRAAFMMDKLMGRVGLHGRAFIPLLSSYACAIPGIMATRTIENRRDRLITIMVSPLMTCSARLPVYSLLIAAFIPNIPLFAGLKLQGVVMLMLYLAGVIAGLGMAFVFRRTVLQGETPTLLLELPRYKWPDPKNIMIGLLERAAMFVRRAGTVILSVSVVLWFLASYPAAPPESERNGAPAISYSYAGAIGQALEPIVQPIGFNWKIAVALVPGFAAREVMIGSLATVYAVEEKEEGGIKILANSLAKDFSIATGLSLLVWYVLACQCASTLAVTKRETNSWKWPAFMLFYMTVLAYVASWVTYHLALSLGWG